MKKLLALLAVLGLVACGSKPVVTKAEDFVYTSADGETVIHVDVELEDGKITKVVVDQEYADKEGNPSTKRTLGDAYGMAGTSQAKGVITENGGEWYEQADHYQEKLIGTTGEIALDEKGYPTDADVKAGCTMNLTELQNAVKAAVAAAK